ncbi:hypothetical protein ACNFCJ_20785 [Pseudomonas sp. NY15364]|uniref:hypothetical protein n=1 Tax=Pseudomonas sp. NY15364 TaxID=3400353 RepID=UPI003A85F712
MSRVRTQLVIDGQNNTKKAFDEVDGSLTKLSGMAVKAGAALAGALSIGVLANWVKESALATAQMARMAELSGSTAEEFQRWAYASRTVGIEQDKLGDIFKDVQDKIGDFLQTGGGPMADFFENIAPKVGVTAEQFRNLSGPQALQLYVSSLQQANLSQSEMTFYMEAIANDATLLLPLLANNSAAFSDLAREAEDLGLVLSNDAAAGALEFERGLNTLGAVSDGAGKQISAELVPTLNVLTGLLADNAREGGYTAEIANVLSFGLKVLASAAIVAGNAFGSLGRFIGGAAAAAAAAASGEFAQAADIMRAVGEDNARETGAAIERVKNLWDGTYEQQGRRAREVYEQQVQLNDQLVTSSKGTTDQLKEQYKSVSDEAKKRIREITAAEREANSEVERLRKERLDIDKRYNDLRAKIAGGGAGDPSYGQANQLKVAARDALRNGDLEKARSNAQAAAKILGDLAASGQNTYGLQGFANELQAIEAQANAIEQTAADQKLATLSALLKDLKDQADIKITADLSPEEIAKVQQQIQALATDLSSKFIITPTITLGDVSSTNGGVAPATPPAFATGGKVTGPGTGTSDSILARLSNGEYVLRAAAVRQYGTALLDRMNGLHMPAFADGGVVETVAGMSPQFPNLGRMVLESGGQEVSVFVEQTQAPNMRRLATKFGGSSRRK